mmetsp:Transcript_69598/g.185293  ORF Transcript_69598/g.185293 Transcript_69598/m.185293 type:complete len:851 (-) Transcript_69598:335-2887(-)
MGEDGGRKEKDWLTAGDCARVLADIRSPLNSITGLTEALKMMSRDTDLQKVMSLMNRCSIRLAAHAEKTLQFDKICSGGVVLHKESFELGWILMEVCEFLRHAREGASAPVCGENVELVVELPPNWEKGGPKVEGDSSMIASSLYHVVQNALQYTPKGTVHVSGSDTKEWVVITVKDTGVGMDPEQMEKICKPFTKFSSSPWGLGLGLAACQEVCDCHGGSIVIQSVEGEGTTVTLRLPRKCELPKSLDRGPLGFGYYVDTRKKKLGRRDLTKRALGIFAHELRMPLRGMAGLAEHLAQSSETAKLKQLPMVHRYASRVCDMLAVLDDAAMFLEKKVTPVWKKVRVPMTAEAVYKALDAAKDNRNEPIKKRTVNFFVEVPNNIAEIECDESRLFKMLYHVGENALKFTQKGEVRMYGKQKKDEVTIIVEDSGVGIPVDAQRDIFRPFVRLQGDKFGGLGLGLTVVQAVVKTFGGRLEVESLEGDGGGTKIFITLPKRALTDKHAPPSARGVLEKGQDDASMGGTPLPTPSVTPNGTVLELAEVADNPPSAEGQDQPSDLGKAPTPTFDAPPTPAQELLPPDPEPDPVVDPPVDAELEAVTQPAEVIRPREWAAQGQTLAPYQNDPQFSSAATLGGGGGIRDDLEFSAHGVNGIYEAENRRLRDQIRMLEFHRDNGLGMGGYDPTLVAALKDQVRQLQQQLNIARQAPPAQDLDFQRDKVDVHAGQKILDLEASVLAAETRVSGLEQRLREKDQELAAMKKQLTAVADQNKDGLPPSAAFDLQLQQRDEVIQNMQRRAQDDAKLIRHLQLDLQFRERQVVERQREVDELNRQLLLARRQTDGAYRYPLGLT